MGYQTSFQLTVSEPGPDNDEVAAKLAELTDGFGPEHANHQLNASVWTTILNGEEADPWYDHEMDMKEVSLAWPGVLFTLRGYGEEPGDEWVEYHRDGLMQQEYRPEWNPPTFDPQKLQPHWSQGLTLP